MSCFNPGLACRELWPDDRQTGRYLPSVPADKVSSREPKPILTKMPTASKTTRPCSASGTGKGVEPCEAR
jgi:hypothetical protein